MKKAKQKLLTALVLSACIAPAWAAEEIEISAIVSNGSTPSYKEAAPNLWFLLDNSGSMASTVSYDPNASYAIPKRINGTSMPTPPKATGGKLTYYLHPFNNDAADVAFATRTANISSTYQTTQNFANWYSYYRTRLMTLKSAMSLSFLKTNPSDEDLRLRVGYMMLNRQWSATQTVNGHKKTCSQVSNTFPVSPFNTTNGLTNRDSMKRWLYNLCTTGMTPMRGQAANLYTGIYANAKSTPTDAQLTDNPFVSNPEQPYNAQSNPILSCRRNYVVLLTDGVWNNIRNRDARAALSSFPSVPWYTYTDRNGQTITVNRPVTTEDDYTLPDNKAYSPMSPYRKTVTRTDNNQLNDNTLADIAFLGWITDIDGNENNNDLTEKVVRINNVIQTHNGSEYWHPYNDYASWQHINTFSIGFGLAGSSTANGRSNSDSTVNVNPPPEGTTTGGINSKYLTSGFSWTINTRYSGSSWRTYINDPSLQGDMANAAVNGRGRFYNVNVAADMISAFNDIMVNAQEGGEIPSVRGSSGVTGSTRSLGNAFYSTLYDSESFTGELQKKNLYDGNSSSISTCFPSNTSASHHYGEVCEDAAWNASKILTQFVDGGGTRNIVSVKRTYDGADLTVSTATPDISKLGYSQIPFEKASLTPYLTSRLVNNFPGFLSSNFSDNDERLTKLIDYIKGDGTEESTSTTAGSTQLFRSREYPYTPTDKQRNVLGALMRSSPVLSGVPTINSANPIQQAEEYREFVNRYIYVEDTNGVSTSVCLDPNIDCSGAAIDEGLVQMLYVGANDGMMHAFRADTGQEVFAYVPNALYDKLPSLLKSDTQVSFVDGNIDVQPVYTLDSNGKAVWKKALVGTMGGGARGLYALDVTDPKYATGKNYAMWEYSETESKIHNGGTSNIGNIIAKPGIVQLADGTWAVVVGNGYNSESEKATLIVINLETGKPIQELVVENSAGGYTDSSKVNGLGPVYFVAHAGKTAATASYVDRAYAGDLQGNLWVFDFTASSKNGGIKVDKKAGTTAQVPLFTAKYKDTNGVEIRQPITVAPLVQKHPKNYGYLVHFGTGALFSRDDLSSTITNSIYAIWDDWVPADKGGITVPRTGTPVVINRSDDSLNQLREIEFTILSGKEETTRDDNKVTARLLSRDPDKNTPIRWAYDGSNSDFSELKRGWFVDLLTGERAWQPAYNSYGGNGAEGIGYKTVRYLGENGAAVNQTECTTSTSSVEGWTLSFNPEDGTQYLDGSGTLDTNGDGIIDVQDQVKITETVNGTSITVYENVTGIKSNSVGYNPAEQTLKNSDNADPSERLCRTVSEIVVNSNGTITSKQVCRASFIGSWGELR